jgi:glycosylphosphatidylinositol transamidase
VQTLSPAFAVFTVLSSVLPLIISQVLSTFYKPTAQHYQLIKSFSLLVLGMTLSTLATLNFSLAFLVGLLSSPLTFAASSKNGALRYSAAGLLNLVAPPAVVYTAAYMADVAVADVLRAASFGWDVWGMYTPLVFWCVWWPAWLVGTVGVLAPLP